MKYFMGLDLSLTGTGYAILNEQAQIMKIGTLTSKNKGAARLNDIENEITNILMDHKFVQSICGVMIEGYAFSARFSHAHALGELGGVIRLRLHRFNIPFWECPPTTLKKYITGSGKGDKNIILKAVYKKWGIDCADDNQADAYSLARLLHAKNVGPKHILGPVLAYENECLNVIFNPKPKQKKQEA